jgi:hypothetical protein
MLRIRERLSGSENSDVDDGVGSTHRCHHRARPLGLTHNNAFLATDPDNSGKMP